MFNGNSYLRYLAPLLAVTLACAWAVAQNTMQGPQQPQASQVADQPAPAAKPDSSPESAPKMFLGPGDEMDISVFGVPELSQHTRVSSDGKIYMPLLGYVPVGGMSVEETQSLLETLLVNGGYVKHPQVTIYVKEYTAQGVSVIGEVNKPGVYPVLGSRTLLDMLLLAGGLAQRAGNAVTITHRQHPDEPVSVKLGSDLQSLENKTAEVLPGDVISVSRAGIVYVIGDVNRPGGFVMANATMNLVEAIALAAGPTSTAALNSTKMLRKTPQGLQETHVPLKKILQAKSPDIPLQADDIIFVPRSLGKTIVSRSSQSLLSLVTTAAIYRP